MNREEFYDYINENFPILRKNTVAMRLISNILKYVEENHPEENDQYLALSDLLYGTGLTDDEIKQVYI